MKQDVPPRKARPPKPKSLANRLTRNFFLRQLTTFLCIDLMLALLAICGILYWGENRCSDVARLVEEHGLPSQETTEWLWAGDFIITEEGREHTVSIGFYPTVFPQFFHSSDSLRSTDFFTYYRMELDHAKGYAVEVSLVDVGRLLMLGAVILLGAQLLSLLTGSVTNSRAIRHTLRPIQDMAATAARLTSATHLSRREMEALAGKLDQISGTNLDSRIDLPTTQKELHSLAQAINSLLDRVNRSYRAQMQFVSNASHELRTPIAVIQGYAALLDRWGKSDPATQQEAIDAIRSEAKSMELLVEQLLFLARGDNDSQPVRREVFDLTELAGEVLRDAILIHQDRPILPSWEGPLPVNADPALIKQVMRILMDNSIKYSAGDQRVWLRVTRWADGYARVTVQDEGMGIAPESLPHIFDRFYRADASRARSTGGTGLGLAIAQWIVEEHNGWFEVVSREGFGSRMSFLIPLETARREDGKSA